MNNPADVVTIRRLKFWPLGLARGLLNRVNDAPFRVDDAAQRVFSPGRLRLVGVLVSRDDPADSREIPAESRTVRVECRFLEVRESDPVRYEPGDFSALFPAVG